MFSEKPVVSKNTISIRSTTNNSIEIEWQHLTGITEILKEYYGYLIQYKDDTTDGSYIDVRVNYTSSSYWKIENLNSYTNYSIEIKPFRMFDNYKDYGSPYPVLHTRTKCGSKYVYNTLMILIVFCLKFCNTLWRSTLLGYNYWRDSMRVGTYLNESHKLFKYYLDHHQPLK